MLHLGIYLGLSESKSLLGSSGVGIGVGAGGSGSGIFSQLLFFKMNPILHMHY